jgi:hypothetical protein
MSQVLGAFGLLDFTMLQPCSCLAGVLKLMNHLFNFPIFLGCGEPQITETADTESVDTGARLYV